MPYQQSRKDNNDTLIPLTSTAGSQNDSWNSLAAIPAELNLEFNSRNRIKRFLAPPEPIAGFAFPALYNEDACQLLHRGRVSFVGGFAKPLLSFIIFVTIEELETEITNPGYVSSTGP
ncbi:MAG TPA: hypothetical protein VFB06_37550 [Streptosporangiaceae bacterium]|nr:hypothetical protein [Streptosporangiaceae bacterium]